MQNLRISYSILGYPLRFPILQYLFQILMLLEMIAIRLVEVEYAFL
jgi:hypothetical protein